MKNYTHFITTWFTTAKLPQLVSAVALVTLLGYQGIQPTRQDLAVQVVRRPLLATCRVCQDELLAAAQLQATAPTPKPTSVEPIVRPTGPR